MDNIEILYAGFVCADILKTSERDQVMLGGTAANVATILSLMSIKSFFLTAYYEDPFGQWLENSFEDRGILPIYFCATKRHWPEIIEEFNEKTYAHKFYTSCPVCGVKMATCVLPSQNHLNIISPNFLERCNMFFYDRMSEGIKKIAHLNQKGWNFYEPNSCRNYRNLIDNMRGADIVKFSQDRISIDVAEKLASDLAESNIKLFIMTMGENGLSYKLRINAYEFSDWTYVPAIRCNKVIDSSGAGDWLTAGIILYLMERYPFCTDQIDNEILQHIFSKAQNLAAIKCGYMGAQGILFSRAGVAELEGEINIPLKVLNNRELKLSGGCSFCRS